MHTRAVVVALAAGVLAIGATACGSNKSSSVNPAYGDCQVSGRRGEFRLTPHTPGTLTVEATLPSPGWWNGTPDSMQDGYEYCMAANIAYRAGLDRVKVKSVPFADLVAGKTKGFDLALSEITITPPREKVADYSPSYLAVDQGVLSRTGATINARNIGHVRIGVSDGTTGEAFVKTRLKPAGPVTVFHNDPEMISALAHGRVDAVVHDTTILLAYAQRSNGKLHVIGRYRTGEHYGALYPKGSPNKATVDRIIRQLIDDGTLARLSAVYLGRAYGRDPAGIPFFQVEQAR